VNIEEPYFLISYIADVPIIFLRDWTTSDSQSNREICFFKVFFKEIEAFSGMTGGNKKKNCFSL
jgi:hypothetical protein